jgi:molybdate transport system regulatory protein
MLSRMADTAKTKPRPATKTTTMSVTKSVNPRPEVRFRMRIRSGEAVALGPGKVELLEAVREYGSISAAARSLDMSYRRAWLLIDELNRSLKAPATHSEQGGQSGGGCTLTPVGERIIRLYRDIEVEAQRSCAKQIAELTRLIRS